MATINPKQVAAFRAVMLTGGITRAAEMIHLTQPAVSRLIKEFEYTVGLKLFERTGSGIVPTREANVIFAEVERLFTGLERIMALAIELREEPSQSLRIAAFPAFGNGFLPRFLAKLQKRTPEYVPSVFALASSDVINYVSEDKCDLGVATTMPDHPSVSIAAIETIPFVVALPKGHPLTEEPFLEPRHFSEQALISTSQTVMNIRIGAMFAASGVTPRIVAQTSSSTAACAMVSAGMGISVVDPFAAQEAETDGVVIRALRPSISFDFAYVLPAKREPFAMVTQTIRALQAEIELLRRARSFSEIL